MDNMVGAYVVAVTSMAVTTNKPFLITNERAIFYWIVKYLQNRIEGDSSNKNKSKVCQKCFGQRKRPKMSKWVNSGRNGCLASFEMIKAENVPSVLIVYL